MRNHLQACNISTVRMSLTVVFLAVSAMVVLCGCMKDRTFDNLQTRRMEIFGEKADDPPEIISVNKAGRTIQVSRMIFPVNSGKGIIRAHHYINFNPWEYYSGIIFPIRSETVSTEIRVQIFVPAGTGYIDETYQSESMFRLEPDRWYDVKIPFQEFFGIRAGKPFPTTMLPRTTTNKWEVVLFRGRLDSDAVVLNWGAVTVYRDRPKFRFW